MHTVGLFGIVGGGVELRLVVSEWFCVLLSWYFMWWMSGASRSMSPRKIIHHIIINAAVSNDAMRIALSVVRM